MGLDNQAKKCSRPNKVRLPEGFCVCFFLQKTERRDAHGNNSFKLIKYKYSLERISLMRYNGVW